MIEKPICYMTIGVPYSGKSTYYQEFVKLRQDTHRFNYALIDTDSYLEDMAFNLGISYNEAFRHHIKNATKDMYRKLNEALTLNHDIFWDQTNMTKKARAKKLIMIPDHYEKVAVVFPVPSDVELAQRMKKRTDKVIDKSVIEAMANSYEPPELDEGFDCISWPWSPPNG